MNKSDSAHWEPHITALREVCDHWNFDDDFKDFFARVAVSYLKPRWSVHETLEGHTAVVWCITHFTMGDTHMLVSGSDDRTVRVWRCDAGTQRWDAHETLEGHTDRVWCITHFTMGGTYMLVSESAGRTVRVWRANRKNTRTELFR